MKLRQLIEIYLKEAVLLQIATTSNGAPWVCTVSFACDSEFNLYWFSRHNTRHSKEIAANPRVAGAVMQPYVIGDKTRGLQLSGEASNVCTEPEVSLGLAAMQQRFGVKQSKVEQFRQEFLDQTTDYGLYRLRPDSIILCDKLNFPDSPWQEYKVPTKASPTQTAA